MQSIFYDVSSLSEDDKLILLAEAKRKNSNWWVDKLDCAKSFSREPIKMSFDNIIKKLDETAHFVVIKRYDHIENKYYGEIGFSTMGSNVNYFLFIYLKEIHLDYIIDIFELTKQEV